MYELSHDTLVAPILGAKKKRLEEERLRAERAAQAEREKELARERKRRQLATVLAIVGFLLFGIALLASVVAVNKTRQAREAEQVAEENLDRFLAAQAEKDRLRVRQLTQDAETYAGAYEYELAIEKLEEALAIDSTSEGIRSKIELYEKRIQQ